MSTTITTNIEGQTLTVFSNGCHMWKLNGELHREDGPARYFPEYGEEKWFFHGRLHNTKGPACVYPEGDKYYFVYGKSMSYEQWKDKYQSYHLKAINTSKSKTKPTIFVI